MNYHQISIITITASVDHFPGVETDFVMCPAVDLQCILLQPGEHIIRNNMAPDLGRMNTIYTM